MEITIMGYSIGSGIRIRFFIPSKPKVVHWRFGLGACDLEV